MNVRIISTPPGEAPEHIRAAWVGIVLPLLASEARTFETVGVVSRPKTWLGLMFARLLGRTRQERGYIVDANRAVEILATHSPEAAQWWRENAAFSIQPGQYFLFASDACEEVAS